MTRIALQHILTIILLVIAGILEVFGDAKIREAFEVRQWSSCLIGATSLVVYGLFVNLAIALKLIDWSFSKQLGFYVAIFAATSSVYGSNYLHENISRLHWFGLSIVIIGGIVIGFSRN